MTSAPDLALTPRRQTTRTSVLVRHQTLALGLCLSMSLGLSPLWPSSVMAGTDSVAGHTAKRLPPQEVATFSKRIEDTLAARGATAALVFRTGRARSDLPKGLNYTHGAFWVHASIPTKDGRTLSGYAVYNLYSGNGKDAPKEQSYLAQDWPYDFTAGASVPDVGILIPNPELQDRIVTLINSGQYKRFHNPNYSLIANPLKRKYQNCNSFMLSVLTSAASGELDPIKVQALVEAHFKPSPVEVSGLKRSLVPIIDPRVKTDDQGPVILTTTYESLRDYLKTLELLDEALVLQKDGPIPPAPLGASQVGQP